MDTAHRGFDSFCLQKFVPNMHSKNCLILNCNFSDCDLKVSLAVVPSDKGLSLRGNNSLHSIHPVGVLAMTGMVRGPLTGMSGTTVVELMKG